MNKSPRIAPGLTTANMTMSVSTAKFKAMSKKRHTRRTNQVGAVSQTLKKNCTGSARQCTTAIQAHSTTFPTHQMSSLVRPRESRLTRTMNQQSFARPVLRKKVPRAQTPLTQLKQKTPPLNNKHTTSSCPTSTSAHDKSMSSTARCAGIQRTSCASMLPWATRLLPQ